MIELLREYQEKLRMMDWDLYLKTDCTTEDMSDENWVAQCNHHTVHRIAYINMLSEQEMINRGYIKDNLKLEMESSLVHEMLHAKFAIPQGNVDKGSFDVIHQNIEDLAVALVCAKHDIDVFQFIHTEEDGYERA